MTNTPTKRGLPEAFEAEAAVCSIATLAERYGVTYSTISRWRSQLGIAHSREMCIKLSAEAKLIPAPADLAERAAEMHLAALERHYGRTRKTIHRWLDEAGIVQKAPPPSRGKPDLHLHAYKNTSRKQAKRRIERPSPWVAHNVALPSGAEQEAAQHLRRYTFVFRCSPTGNADQKGKFWRYGNAVLTPEDLIARAKRHGFDPDAWRRVAA